MNKLIAGCLMAVAFFAASLKATDGGSQSIQGMLDRAYEVRRTNRAEFQSLLEKLQERKGSLTKEQNDSLTYLRAYSLSIAGNYEAGTELALSLFRNSESRDVRARSGALIANVFGMRRDYVGALRTTQETVEMVDDSMGSDVRNQVWGTAAMSYAEAGQMELAIQFANKVIEATADPSEICIANNVRDEALFRSGKQDGSIEDSIKKGVAICDEIGDAIVANSLRALLAEIMLKQGKYEQGIALLSEHQEEVTDTKFKFLILRFKSLLAQLHEEKGDLALAETYATEAIQLAGESPRTLPVVNAYKTLYEVANERRDLDAALVYYRRYADAKQEYLNDTYAREAAFQIVRQEAAQNAIRVKQLGSQNDLLKLQREVEQKSAQNSRLIIVLLILLLGGVGLWAARTRRVHKKLREMAETDALTGVCNRHHFTNQAERSLAMCAGAGEEVALVMFDLDHFKAVNDQYGHAVGDWVLKHVATTSRIFCRRVDTLGRIGGEEFAFLLHGCDLQTAIRLAEDCRARIALIDTIESGYKFTITASFGVASSSVSGYQLTRLLSHADRMLYRAKSLGRNRVCAYDGNTEFDMPAEPLPRTGTVTRIASAHPDAANRNHLSAG